MLKKIAWVLGVILVIALVGGGVLVYRLAGMAHRFEEEIARVCPTDLSRIKDGNYVGSFGNFAVSAKVDVIVKDHKITSIKIIEQSCGQGYNAPETIDRIIAAQSAKVDAVTGASSSSRCLMLAVDRALKKAPRIE